MVVIMISNYILTLKTHKDRYMYAVAAVLGSRVDDLKSFLLLTITTSRNG